MKIYANPNHLVNPVKKMKTSKKYQKIIKKGNTAMILSKSFGIFVLGMMTFFASKSLAQEFTWPRAIATGGYIAVSDDVYGLDWNMAGTALGAAKLQITFMNINNETVTSNYGMLVRLWGRHVLTAKRTPAGEVSTSFDRFPRGRTFEEITSALNLLYDLYYQQDIAYGYAFRLTPQIAFGLDAKRHIYGNNLSASKFWSYSLSASYKRNKYFQFGLVLRNLASRHTQKHNNVVAIRKPFTEEVKVFTVDFDALPFVFTEPKRRLEFGIAVRPFAPLLVSADVFSDAGFSVGFEWQVYKGVYLRQGVSSKSDGLIKGKNLFSLGTGLGIKYGSAHLDLGWHLTPKERDDLNTTTSLGKLNMGPRTNDVLLISLLFDVK